MSRKYDVQLAFDFSGTRPLSEVLDQTRVIREQRAASLREADPAEITDAEMAAKKEAVRVALMATLGEEIFKKIAAGQHLTAREREIARQRCQERIDKYERQRQQARR